MVTQGLLGEIAAEIRNSEAAEPHFQLVIEQCREAGWPPEIAWAEFHYAELLLERVSPGDREKATELQHDAIAIAQELGVKPLLERILAHREMLKA